MGMFLRRGPAPHRTRLYDKAEGSIIKIAEAGIPVEFYIAKHNYEAGLNGDGRTLIVRKDCYDMRAFDEDGMNTYASSDLDSWNNGTYRNLLDPKVREAIGTTTIYVSASKRDYSLTTIQRAVFQLSLAELGSRGSHSSTEGTALPIASTLKIAYHNGSAVAQWTRSRYISDDNPHNAYTLTAQGTSEDVYSSRKRYSRPAFTLPSNFTITDDMLT